MTNIILIARDRRELTTQAIESIYAHSDADTQAQFNLTILDDASLVAVSSLIAPRKNMVIARISPSKSTVGLARNIGAAVSSGYWGEGSHILFLDNDIAIIRPGWLDRFINAAADAAGPCVIGGCRHPFHKANARQIRTNHGDVLMPVDAVAGYSMFMNWETWDLFGPFASNQPGIGASEDFALCQKVGKCAYLEPPVLAHCGLRNTNGVPATGHMEFERVPGLLYA